MKKTKKEYQVVSLPVHTDRVDLGNGRYEQRGPKRTKVYHVGSKESCLSWMQNPTTILRPKVMILKPTGFTTEEN